MKPVTALPEDLALLALGAGAIAAALVTCGAPALAAQTTVRPEARTQTAPVPHKGDAADDPAVWIHPQDPALSLVLGTDKQGGLHTYNMDGSERQVIVVASVQGGSGGKKVKKKGKGAGGRGVKVWVIDAATRELSDVTDAGSIAVLGGAPPYGVCGYRSARTGRVHVFVTDEKGRVEQYELQAADGGRIGGALVRTLKLRSLTEGCVADDELGFLYVAQESVGIWKFGAAPDAGNVGELVARVGENGLTADVEGLTIYYAARGRGYLIASSQGSNTYKV